ncbi:MAG: SPOR domain-containing protein [Candidatus Omnitrophica bacterium]|nr:SPOR domain-containing protein [Candidatus Omnitrophota bacterium]
MRNTYNKASQLELFSATIDNHGANAVKKTPLFHNINLTVENSVVAGIIILMALVLFFSLGIERGKQLALVTTAPQKIAVAEEPKNAIIARPQILQRFPGAVSGQQVKRQALPVEKAVNVRIPQPQKVSPAVVTPPPKERDLLNDYYTIQVASYKQNDRAQKEALKIKNSWGHETFVVVKGSYSIVCLGKFVKRDEAKLLAGRLKGKYTDYLIRRL